MIPYSLFLKYLLYIDLGVSKQPTSFISDHCYAMKSGSLLPFCNRVGGTSQIAKDEIESILSYYDAIPFRWFVDETDKIQNQLLEKVGFKIDTLYPAMIIELSILKPAQYEQNVEVKEINKDEIALWISIVAKSYNLDNFKEIEFAKFINYIIENADDVKFYIGYFEGKPIASSMTIMHAKVIGVHWVGTLPEFRGKGIGFAVSHKPLVDALKNGFTQAILLASEMGKPVYERIGFTTYALYNVYKR
jgi:GNAT superfamily N-acetyltransferase